jgi:hypothetical protein
MQRIIWANIYDRDLYVILLLRQYRIDLLFQVFIPIYFQACKLSSPLQSSVDTLSLALTIGPASVISGISGKILGRYRPQVSSVLQ